MDNVQVYPSSPQEDEFALLALGARSPYEALIAPCQLAHALALSDPRDLSAPEERQWEDTFNNFLHGVSIVEGNRPLILKSPPHGYRVATLRRLLPNARFILIVRSPEIVFESTVRMWRSLFPIYAMGEIPPEDDTRRAVLGDRPRFETKLTEGLSDLPHERVALIRYEDLVRDPLNVMGLLYEQLCLGNFAEFETDLKAEIASAKQFTPSNTAPSGHWISRVHEEWQSVFEKYGYRVPNPRH
jgi:hypothetical protein